MSRSPREPPSITGNFRHSSINTTANGLLSRSPTIGTLGIIYSLVARGGVILAHYACCHGNFSEVAQQVLTNISLEDDNRLSYASGE